MLNGAFNELLASAARPVRLRHHRQTIVACFDKSNKRDASELRRASKNYPHLIRPLDLNLLGHSIVTTRKLLIHIKGAAFFCLDHFGLDSALLEPRQIINKNFAI
jgi:hypothetical protein